MRPPFTYYGGKIGLADRIVDLMPPHRVYIERCDGVDLIDRLATPDTVVYADPTYVWATRRLSSKPEGWTDRTRQSDYRYELDDKAHRRLAEVLRSTPGRFDFAGGATAGGTA